MKREKGRVLVSQSSSEWASESIESCRKCRRFLDGLNSVQRYLVLESPEQEDGISQNFDGVNSLEKFLFNRLE